MRGAILPALLLLSGCAGQAPPPAVALAASSAAVRGVVVEERPALTGGAAAAILAALRVPAAADQPVAAAQDVEFIVRTDDGRTLSVVQPNRAALRAGEPVILLQDGHTSLVRPAQAGAASGGG